MDIAWKGGRLTAAAIHSLNGNPLRLHYGQTTKLLKTKLGETIYRNGEPRAGKKKRSRAH